MTMETGISERDRLLDRAKGETHELSTLSPIDPVRDVEGSADSTKEDQGETKRKIVGCLLALLGVVLIVVGLVAVQLLNKSVPHMELNGLRFTGTLLIWAFYGMFTRNCNIIVAKGDIKWVITAAIACTLTNYACFGKAYYLPVGTGHGMNLSLGVILNNIVTCFVSKSLRLNEVIASVLCITGVLLTVQPDLLFPHTRPTRVHVNVTFETPCYSTNDVIGASQTHNYTNVTDSEFGSQNGKTSHDTIVGYVLCVVEAVTEVVYLNAIGYGLANVRIGPTIFWIGMMGTLSSFIIMAATETPTFPGAPICIVIVTCHVVTAGLCSVVFPRTVQLIPSIWVQLFGMLTIPLMFIFQYTLLSNIYPGIGNTAELVGALIILIGNLVIPLSELHSCNQSRQ